MSGSTLSNQKRIIVSRYANNPIIQTKDIRPSHPSLAVACVFNPGVFEFDGKIWLLARVAERPHQTQDIASTLFISDGKIEKKEFNRNSPDTSTDDPRYLKYKEEVYLSTLSHLRLLCSVDGISFIEPDGSYQNMIIGEGQTEIYGVEDCRITKIEDEYYLTYTQVSPFGVGCGLIQTVDWKNLNRMGTIFLPPNKDCAIFDRKIQDQYFCFNRPSGNFFGGLNIWISSSPDLIHWGNHHCLMTTRKGMWDEQRVGAGAAPIETESGWLAIYHGADRNQRYCLGAILLDRDDPRKILARSTDPIMEPEYDYEQNGFFSEVIFTNGHLIRGDEIWMYYGSSDESICMAKLSITNILDSLGVS